MFVVLQNFEKLVLNVLQIINLNRKPVLQQLIKSWKFSKNPYNNTLSFSCSLKGPSFYFVLETQRT